MAQQAPSEGLMTKAIEYAQTMSNFQSGYNVSAADIYKSILRPAESSLGPYRGTRSTSPLFQRSASPPLRVPFPTGSPPKFNFDLYRVDEFDMTPRIVTRPISPPKSNYFEPNYSYAHRPSSPIDEPSALSKLRQVNDELYQALVRSDTVDPILSNSNQYHIHHYPISQISPLTYRVPSPTYRRPFESLPKTHKARVTYNIHIPRQHREEYSARKVAPSRVDRNYATPYEESLSDEPIIIDFYPTGDRYVRIEKENEHNADNSLTRGTRSTRDDHLIRSDTNHYSLHTSHQYDHERRLDEIPERLNQHKERQPTGVRHRSPFVTSRIRPDSAPSYQPDPFRDTPTVLSKSEPIRHASSTKRSKDVQSSSARSNALKQETNQDPSVRPSGNQHILAFESPIELSPRPNYTRKSSQPTGRKSNSEPNSDRSDKSARLKTQHDSHKPKQHTEESLTNGSASWGPTVNRLKPKSRQATDGNISLNQRKGSMGSDSNSSRASSVKEKAEKSTGHDRRQSDQEKSVLNDNSRPAESALQDTPKVDDQEQNASNNQEIHGGEEASGKEHNENESIASDVERSVEITDRKGEDSGGDNPRLEESDGTETPLPEENLDNLQTEQPVDHDDEPANPTNGNPAESVLEKPVSDARDDGSNVRKSGDESIHEEDDAADREVAGTMDFNAWLQNMAGTINAHAKQPISSIPQSKNTSPAKSNARSSPRERQRTPSPKTPIPDEQLYKPPFGPNKISSTGSNRSNDSPPMTTNDDNKVDVDDFFS